MTYTQKDLEDAYGKGIQLGRKIQHEIDIDFGEIAVKSVSQEDHDALQMTYDETSEILGEYMNENAALKLIVASMRYTGEPVKDGQIVDPWEKVSTGLTPQAELVELPEDTGNYGQSRPARYGAKVTYREEDFSNRYHKNNFDKRPLK